MNQKTGGWLTLGAVLFLSLASPPVDARDAAFMDPGIGGGSVGQGAMRVEPNGDIDTGESILNVARRTNIFFVNQTSQPVHVDKMAANGDGNVTAEITNDDCSKQGTIPAQSRCSVEVAVTPTSPGAWSVDVLMTHNGAGRIARSRLTGKTSGAGKDSEKKDNGLTLSSKEAAPVNFGDIEVGAKVVRSALMVNDSVEAITLYSIDIIEAENGLQRLDQGCAVDMELKPGESCPVTMLWQPQASGQISTDLIIRHSGRMGFAVIPIRGTAKGEAVKVTDKDQGKSAKSGSDNAKDIVPAPPSAQDLEKIAASHITAPPVSAKSLSSGSSGSSSGGVVRLIGTVGNRAVLLKPDGTTVVLAVNESADDPDHQIKLVSLGAKSAGVLFDGKKVNLVLGASPELTEKARSAKQESGGSGSGELPVNPTPSSDALRSTPLLPASAGGGK